MSAELSGATAAEPLSVEDQGRAGFYGVIAGLFAGPPAATLLAALAQADEIDAESGELGEAWNALVQAAAIVPAQAIAEEYERLFVGVGRPAVMLYGSFYLAGFMMEKPLARLRDDLAQLGLSRSGTREPEDHFAALMEAMRHLVADPGRSQAERATLQQRFFSRHVEPWYGRLIEALEHAEGVNFYRRAGRFARSFLDVEKESFSIAA